MKMFGLFGGKKKSSTHQMSADTKKKIQQEIENVLGIKDGFVSKYKENENDYYITVVVDKRVIGIDTDLQKSKVPDYIGFLIIVDYNYPDTHPFVLAKSNFSNPSLMDGRDLFDEICPNWSENSKLEDIVKGLPTFLRKVVTAPGYNFYGTFHLGTVYDLKNFENMVVNEFSCKYDRPEVENAKIPNIFTEYADYTLILSGDALILFDKMETGNGKILFWGALYSITNLQINKMKKIVNLSFYDDETTTEFDLQLKIENILFFRDTLVKKMSSLKVKSESTKLVKGHNIGRRLTNKEIITMKIEDIEKNVKDLEKRIEKGEINDYTVKTFSTLCGKAIEHYSMIGSDKHIEFLMVMKKILNLESVQKLTIEDENEMKNAGKENSQ